MRSEKIQQAIQLLQELDIDLWLTFVSETEVRKDPVLDLILGTNCTWQSAFIITQRGDTIALVGSLDCERIKRTNLYTDVRGYVNDFGPQFRELISALNPRQIAINYSVNDFMADGLTHGMFLLLQRYLKGLPQQKSLISAEKLIAALRSRKTTSEINLIGEAVRLTEEILDQAGKYIKAGRTEKEVAAFILSLVAKYGVTTAWESESCPAVFTGPQSAGAHASPTDRVIEPGHVLNIDFGVKYKEYCADLQRTWYILRPGETNAPPEVQHGFRVLLESIRKAVEYIKPGRQGWEIDHQARSHIVAAGYPEYPHALGHQVGRSTHDGAGLLGPKWERYGESIKIPLEAGQVFTIEPRLPIPNYGVATVEDMLVVTEKGYTWISHPQERIYLIDSWK